MVTTEGWRHRRSSRKWGRFDETYHASFSQIYAYCRRRTRSREDTEDAVADTYLVAWRRLDELEAADYPIAWLYGVARRVLANQRKSLERHELVEVRAAAFSPSTAFNDPAQDAVHRSQLGDVLEAMIELSTIDQELLVLAAFEQLSHAEMAVVLEIPIDTIKSRLYRARRRLQERIVRDARPSVVTLPTEESDRRHA
ncbi:RNA polymerase ECF-type sigma factor [hydrothermal vent metagenome]|uniref:RNA polymerase ECF-type sigma factor n=1 Tax=hydrothermal vent metagenome TaxID=652676 RepID=A0A3B0S8T1_9ZZZZ